MGESTFMVILQQCRITVRIEYGIRYYGLSVLRNKKETRKIWSKICSEVHVTCFERYQTF
jgi:hypothetical protein